MRTKITLLLSLFLTLAAGFDVQGQTIINQKNNVVVEENNGAFIVTVDGKTIASGLKSADSSDDKTIVVENSKGLKGVIDYTGKVILDYKYKDIGNSSPTVFVVTEPNGTQYAIDRTTLQRKEAVEVDVYKESVKLWEEQTGRVHVDNMEAAAQKVREQQAKIDADNKAKLAARLETIGYSDGTSGEGRYFVQMRGKRIAEGNQINFLTIDFFDRYWFMAVNNIGKYKGEPRDEWQILAVDTESGEVTDVGGRIYCSYDRQRKTRGYPPVYVNELYCGYGGYSWGGIEPMNYKFRFDGKTELIFAKD